MAKYPMINSDDDDNELDDTITAPAAMALPEPKEGADSQASKDSPPSLNDLLVTKQDLDNARSQKLKLAALGSIGDSIANQQSFGNFFLGKMNPHQDVSGAMKPLEDQADDAIKQKQTLLAQAQKKPELDLMDPNSLASKMTKSSALGVVTRIQNHPALKNDPDTQKNYADLAKVIADPKTPGSYVQQLIDKDPLIKQQMSSDDQSSRLMGMMAMYNARLAQGDQRIAMQKDNQAANAAGSFDKDTILSGLTKQQQQIQRDTHTLQTAQMITPQIFNEVQIGVANAISGGKAAALGAQEKTEFNFLDKTMAELKQRALNKPQDIASPEFKQQLVDVMSRLNQAYQQNMASRAKQMSVGKSYRSNPAAQQAVQQKVDSYSEGEPAPQPSDGGGLIPSANAGGGAQTKVINGVTYTKVQGGWKKVQ